MGTNLFRVRQGDILLTKIDSLPVGVTSIKDKTLAYGEVTGHTHRFVDSERINRFSLGEKTYLQILSPTVLTHEEHNRWQQWDGGLGEYVSHTGIIEPGIYEQEGEQEYDYIDEEAKKAID